MSYIERIAAAQHHLCCYCNHRMIRHQHIFGVATPRNAITKDHVEPRVYGGITHPSNMVAACCQCNNLRGEMDAQAFCNLMRKWFKRDPTLWIRWHTLSREELSEYKSQCLLVHERHLRGRAIRHIECAFRHDDFSFRERRRLQRA